MFIHFLITNLNHFINLQLDYFGSFFSKVFFDTPYVNVIKAGQHTLTHTGCVQKHTRTVARAAWKQFKAGQTCLKTSEIIILIMSWKSHDWQNRKFRHN